MQSDDMTRTASCREWREADIFDRVLDNDLPDDVERLAELYHRRVDIETDIRNLKVVLHAETIRARTIDTFLKELHASIVPVSVGQPATWSSNFAAKPPNKPACRHVA